MAVNGSSLLSGLSPCLPPLMVDISEKPLLWCGVCMRCLMGTFWGLAVGAGLGVVLPLTLGCSLFQWPQSGFSASLTICCVFYTQIRSLNLELPSLYVSFPSSLLHLPSLKYKPSIWF